MTVKLFVTFVSLLLLVACQNTPPDASQKALEPVKIKTFKAQKLDPKSDDLPTEVGQNPVELSHFTAPRQLAGLQYDGEISSDSMRTFRYHNDDNTEQLNLMVYGLPPGWQLMTPQRAVAGNYGEVRQRLVNRALQNSANALTIVSERLIDLEGHPTAQAEMRWVEAGRPIENRALLLTLVDGTYIRVANASYKQNSRWLLQQTKRALAEFRAAQNNNDDTRPAAH
ncbi:hypothetical protein A11A3_04980 [Alcanivorax hongdengensis A-11-3]|uniref:Lipoprotein n=1 Tax=Alcanivorax hongdengensis A-11-3 TaxID=1177179 RepID=L0WE39_9GAMM|nr:hypothetical protein [Alcanivorax hongdengensis]EKF75306.1 hypothetical protein A11A3_04980 [Alcanivorax hongdengensis A-11-3]